jgi:hypothetical protein
MMNNGAPMFPNVLFNMGDSMLLNEAWIPAVGATPINIVQAQGCAVQQWKVPDITNPGTTTTSLATNSIQASLQQKVWRRSDHMS